MKKDRVFRLLGMLLALVLLTTTLLTPVHAGEAEAVGAADELIVDDMTYAESIDSDAISEEGSEAVEDDAEIVLPEATMESGPQDASDESVPSDESSLSDINADGAESDIVAAETEEGTDSLADEELVGAAISEGLYYIQSALGSSLVLEVAGGSTANSANIRLSTNAGNFSQAFYVKSDGSGGYYLLNYHTKKRVVVAGGSTENGANVQQYQPSSAKSQHWYAIKGSKSGYYQFRNGSASGKAMEVAGSSARAGANVQIGSASASASGQQWKLVPVSGKVAAEARLADSKLKTGYYSFALSDASSSFMEVAGAGTDNKVNIRLGASSNGKEQIFYVTSLGNGLYSIVNPNSGKALTASTAWISNGTNIYQNTYSGSTTQKWYIKKDTGSGRYVISNYKASHKVLATSGNSTKAGANIQNASFDAGKGQYWTIYSRSEAEAYRLENGVYAITSALNSSRDMAVESAAVTNDTPIEIAAAGEKNSQRFIVTCVDRNNFVYTIVNQNSRKNLAVSGSRVIQTSPGSSAYQKWVIKHSGDRYTISCLANGRNISVIGGSSAAGTNLEVVSPGSSNAQKWSFRKAAVIYPVERSYTIRPAGNTNYTLHIRSGSMDNNGDVVIYQVNSSANAQKFNLIGNSDGTYYVANIKSGKVLDTYGAKTSSGTNAVQYGRSSRSTQRWYFVPTGDADGSYYIMTSAGTVLSVANGKYVNFSNVCVQSKDNSLKQKFILTPTNPANGWRTTTAGKRSYYVNGSAAKNKWVSIGGKYYYFDGSGVLVVSTIVDGYHVDANGARGSKVDSGGSSSSTGTGSFKTTINGKKTLTSYLHNAFVPAGRTLYIWSGGWGGDTKDSNDASKIGYQKTWQTFYNNNAKSNYDYTKYRFKYFCGLDCSGFAGWVIYNTMYTKDDQDYMVYQSTTVAPTYIKKGWATKTTKYHPGDVVSMDGHVWISLGTCSDNTILLVHSSPKGVQISGTGGKASTLAKKYMQILAPNWPYDIRTVGSGYTTNVTIAQWVVNGSGIMKDPDGLQKMSAEQVMKFLFGE